MRPIDGDETPNGIYELPPYRVSQLHSKAIGNSVVADFEDLVTHHPIANNSAHFEKGALVGTEDPVNRSYGLIDGEIQELETRRTDRGSKALKEYQVLLIKDFMLEDSRIAVGGRGSREVDVPSPVAGYVGRVSPAEGRVDIYDRKDGDVIARIRHMSPIQVQVGDSVAYGQSLGTQGKVGLGPGGHVHVHAEIDTRYHQQYENYIADLVGGRLAIDPERRTRGIEPLPVFDDGTFRIGEKNARIGDLQRVLVDAGYRDAHGKPIEADGIYRLGMQNAVLKFQADHRLPQTGDIDAATLRLAPAPLKRESDRLDHSDRGRGPIAYDSALLQQARAAVSRLDADLGRTPDHASECLSASLACVARESGLRRIDHVVLSNADAQGRRENAFVVQGRLDDPAHDRARIALDVAVRTPVDESLLRLQQLDQHLSAQHLSAQHQTQAQEEQVQQQTRHRTLSM